MLHRQSEEHCHERYHESGKPFAIVGDFSYGIEVGEVAGIFSLPHETVVNRKGLPPDCQLVQLALNSNALF